MAVISTKEYQNKKDFAAALENAAGFDRFVVDDLQGTERDGKGTWSTDRMARGENTTLAMYSAIAARMAETDFQKFVKLSGRFVATAKKKAESDAGRDGKASYYAEWQTRDGETYYIFRSLGNAAKYEQLWDWANGMGVELRLNWLAEGEEPKLPEPEEASETADGDDEDEELPPVKSRECSLVTKDEKLCLYDNREERFITIPWDDKPGEGVGAMLACEKICGHKTVLEYDDEQMEDKEIRREYLLGYRYRLEENGPWGFISRRFSQAVSPRFRELRVQPKAFDMILSDDANEWTVWGWELREWEHCDRERLELWTTMPREDEDGECDLVMESVAQTARRWFDESHGNEPEDPEERFEYENWPDDEDVPGEEPYFDYSPAVRSLTYAADREGRCFLISGRDKDMESRYSSVVLRASDHILHRGNGAEPFFGWGYVRYEAPHFDRLRYLTDDSNHFGYYAAQRDGYWALLKGRKTITPFAFTWIEAFPDQSGITTGVFQVERFGKRGVVLYNDFSFYFESDRPVYPVPCEYESVELSVLDEGDDLFGSNERSRLVFTVRRMGFVGKLDGHGEWVEQLHREKEESSDFDFDPDGGQ